MNTKLLLPLDELYKTFILVVDRQPVPNSWNTTTLTASGIQKRILRLESRLSELEQEEIKLFKRSYRGQNFSQLSNEGKKLYKAITGREFNDDSP